MNTKLLKSLTLAAAVGGLMVRSSLGIISEPDKIYFGTITLNGQAITANTGYQSNNVSSYVVDVRTNVGGTPIQSYAMGSDTNYHPYFYGIRLDLEAFLTNQSAQVLAGQTLFLTLRNGGTPLMTHTQVISERAQTRLDFGPAADSDGDGIPDLEEYDVHHTNPLAQDTDGDGLTDFREVYLLGSSPLLADTDGDGTPDGAEVASQTDPANSNSFPATVSGTLAYSGLQTGTLWVSAARYTNDNLSLRLNGSGQYLSVSGLTYATAGQVTSLTVEAWVKTTSSLANVVASWDRGAAWELAIGNGTPGRTVFTTVDSTGTTNVLVGFRSINDGSWHHIAAVFSSTNGAKRIYVDGVPDGVKTNAHVAGVGLFHPNGAATRAGFIGVNSTAAAFDGTHGTNYFNGDIDVVRIWDTDLVRSSLVANAYANLSGSELGLRLQYVFDTGSAADSTANGSHGALRGGAAIQTSLLGLRRISSLAAPGAYSITNVPTLNAYHVSAYRDSNGNRTQDYWEAVGNYALNALAVAGNTNPIDIAMVDPDSDSDGLFDYQELFQYNTNPFDSDSDDDGLSDGTEVLTTGTNPNLKDTDSDGLTDGEEVNTYATLPLDWDTDNDTFSDGWEIRAGTDPLNPASFPTENPFNDFDGDGKSDLTVFAPESAVWYIRQSQSLSLRTQQWGWVVTKPQPGDFDGDNKADVTVFDPGTGNWYIQQSSNLATRIQNFGWSEVAPVPADYDGDGKTDIAVYHKATGNWYLLKSSNGQFVQQNWGWSETDPVPGDYDGDGRDDFAVFHPATGNWYIRRSSDGSLLQVNWGWSATLPVPADYDGDGTTDIASYHPGTGTWYIRQSSDLTLRQQTFGWSEVIPVPGDYDGDGKDDLVVYHRQTGVWYLSRSTAGFLTIGFGWSQAFPVFMPPRVLGQ